MNNECGNPESSSGRFLETVRPLRDLESNWTVDLAKNLEEYLLKICSGHISSDEDAIFSVNFAEAALLLQGSVQVYSRKVEYLYSLVLHALDFISQKSQEDQAASASAEQCSSGAHSAKDEEDDPFWGLDDIQVEAKNLLDRATCRDVPPSHFVRPPANLVVLEGECLDSGGDAGELESYLPRMIFTGISFFWTLDAVAVDNFLDSKVGKGQSNVYRASSATSKGRKSFQSPSRQSEGNGHKLSVKKKQDANLAQSPCVDRGFESNYCSTGCSPPAYDFPSDNDGFRMRDGNSEPGDFDDSDDDDDDPWKPLNPHEPGNLKVKPYKKVNTNRRPEIGSRKHLSLSVEFPLAKLRGPISTELTEIWEAKFGVSEKLGKSQSLSHYEKVAALYFVCILAFFSFINITEIWEAEFGASEKLGKSQSLSHYEKLRQSLVVGKREINDAFSNLKINTDDDGCDGGDPDIGPPDFDMPDSTFNGEDVPPHPEKHEDPDAHANLEDLCRSHLDALLATLAENEKQTELATRVSTWKQRIEQNLEEQDARPPFDIHKYGERVLDKLSVEGDGGNDALSFGEVVKGQEKHDVARTFSALLQLVILPLKNLTFLFIEGDKLVNICALLGVSKVNNGDVDLVRSSPNITSTCHSDVNPFYVRLLSNDRKKGVPLQSSRKRGKISNGKENHPAANSSPQGSSSSYRFSVTLGKQSRSRCTPEGKKRRKSRIVAPLDMHFVG
ncbi:UNVERIFIED_CONTAM: Condensin-2 complex subunit H2 [Sesamum latifolium]|uniref:Condensin-2 complex subunit H2 n=1 Tax=Sesamum latifolium TaxID=2727402 RepID=A0AAW2VXH1_9LAMI